MFAAAAAAQTRVDNNFLIGTASHATKCKSKFNNMQLEATANCPVRRVLRFASQVIVERSLFATFLSLSLYHDNVSCSFFYTFAIIHPLILHFLCGWFVCNRVFMRICCRPSSSPCCGYIMTYYCTATHVIILCACLTAMHSSS